MRKVYSLFAALMVAMFAFAQTTPTVTIEIVGGNAIVTPTPSDAQVFFAADATGNYEFSETYTAESFVNEVLGFYDEEEVFAAVCPQGAKTHCLADWGIEAGENTFVAAVVAWDAEAGKAKCLSEVVRVDKTFSEDPVCDEGGEGEEGGEGNTPTDGVTIKIVGGKVVFTPSSEDARYFFAISATDDYGFSAEYTPTNFVDESLEEYIEEYLDYLPVGSYEACLEDYIYEENVEITILAAEVEWDATSESLKRMSDISTLVKTIAEVPACEGGEGGEDDPIMTIEPGKYYVSTFMDATTQYLLTTTTGSAVVLPATLYADANTPTAAHEFEFVALEGQDACFTIQDNTNAFLAVKIVRGLGGMSTQLSLEATKPEAGAVWKVTVQDALNHVTIENTDYTGDIHCIDFDGEKAYCFGTEATGTYDLPILIKVPGTSTNLQEADSNCQVIKTIENGQLILNIDGVRYNILGIAL